MDELLIKITSEKYIQIFVSDPNWNLISCGWDYEHKMFLWCIPYIVYTKKLTR